MKIILLYTAFAIIATMVNLVIQWPFFIFLSGRWTIYIALVFGTMGGLITKYILDKRWIFFYCVKDKLDNLYRFTLYTLMGVITTVIFWGTEICFYYLFDFRGSQYVGGGIGLMIGYLLKYFLDKRFVFKQEII